MLTLTTLPPEILDLICSHVALSSRRLDLDFRSSWSDHQDVRAVNTINASLAALSRTCKLLQQKAQQILYSSLVSNKGFPYLFRTLSRREDLAKHTRFIALGDWGLMNDLEFTSQDHEIAKQLSDKLFYDAAGNPRPGAPDWALSDDFTGSTVFDLDQEGRLATLALLLVPRIERLMLTTYYDGAYGFYAPESLPFLTEIIYHHGDTELGIELSNINGVYAAAPNLRVLKCKMVSGTSGVPRHEGIRELHLDFSCVEGDDLKSIMRSFPFLEVFRYESGGPIVSLDGEATPFEISEALLERKDTLKHVEIDLSDAMWPGDEDQMQSLQPMQVLETLKLETTSVYVETEDETTTNGNHLIDFLPTSIQGFSLARPHEHIHQDILQLAHVAREKFPRLKDVKISGLDKDDEDRLNRAFLLN
ncbi:hypothetical protein FALBO_10471 [Fusarium albosuccineum]|uniref:F-box domain-containing protein n=1 Tax=Fusarium albosuccineum TaxID=1237068 RepID=A0A8H4L5L1_9HYPO|nr:hypothetical protein FALBO_10471 [Fusarium albosuccineum]